MTHTQTDAYSKLLLQCSAPAYEVIWMNGYDAGQAEEDLLINPYHQTDGDCTAWTEGWWAGFYNEIPLYSHYNKQEITDPKKTTRITPSNTSSQHITPLPQNKRSEWAFMPKKHNILTGVLMAIGATLTYTLALAE